MHYVNMDGWHEEDKGFSNLCISSAHCLTYHKPHTNSLIVHTSLAHNSHISDHSATSAEQYKDIQCYLLVTLG